MNEKLLKFLEDIFGKSSKVSENEYLFYCTNCKHYKKKLAINIEIKRGHCWTCPTEKHSNGTIYQLLKKYNKEDKIQEYNEIVGNNYIPLEQFNDKINNKNKVVSKLQLPKEFKSLLQKSNTPDYRKALLYLKQRNINAYDIIKYNIGYCEDGKYSNRIIIPSYDENNNINYFIARSYNDSHIKYLNPQAEKHKILFNANQISWNFPLTIVEGAFDAIAVKRNSIPLLGKTVSNKLLEEIIKNKPKRINMALDQDALKNSIEIAQKLLSLEIPIYIVQLKEKDPSEEGFESMCNLINNAKQLTFSDIVRYKM